MCLNRPEKAKGSKLLVMHFMRNRDQRLGSFTVEAPILDEGPIGNLYGTEISTRLGLKFDQVGPKFQSG